MSTISTVMRRFCETCFVFCTLRLISGKPWPGAGGLAGRGPFGGLDLAGEGEAFLLKGFSLHIRYKEKKNAVRFKSCAK